MEAYRAYRKDVNQRIALVKDRTKALIHDLTHNHMAIS